MFSPNSFLILQQKKIIMEKMTNFSSKHAVYFAISLIATIALIIFMPQLFWVGLPFVCTFFIQMLGWM